ncbi:hypothetical protein BGZ76_006583, partial [Entomortierella beljakovae]
CQKRCQDSSSRHDVESVTSLNPSSGRAPTIAQAAATPTSDADITSLSHMESSPFYKLAKYIFYCVQGRPTALPAVPSSLIPIHDEMFRLALNLLEEPGDVAQKKDVLLRPHRLVERPVELPLSMRGRSKLYFIGKPPEDCVFFAGRVTKFKTNQR